MNMKTQSFIITGYDRVFAPEGLILYPAGKETRPLDADTYNFRNAYILVFDKDGKLYEGGNSLNSGEYSVQKAVCVPAEGFAVAFGSTHPLYDYYLTATEGAVIHNSTISLIYPMKAEYDTDVAMLRITAEHCGKEKAGTEKYLFVGNSCTYINGNPIKFKGLCKAAGKEVSVDYCTYGSAYFYEYADESHPRGQALRNMLKNKKYDYIVLQDGTPCELHKRTEALEVLLELVKENGAKPLLYMRYGYETDKEKRIAANADMYGTFMMMSDLYNIPVAPVAWAFTMCILDHPEINLYADDEGHHSKAGSYLAACCYLYSYCGISPIGNTYTAGIDEKTALILQKVALKACAKDENKKIKEAAQKGVKKAQAKKKKENAPVKWGLIGAAVGVVATVTAMIIVDKKVKKLKKSKK